ncbi:methyltransferase domain-containing protein [Natronobacterium texcoconense]|uniref:Arsenite methyltransferase n=1 Tax=Natronobacterium texcoconense TaxID=1095778 RepID=A0A1H1AZP0_NATTX|nr:methyltransferase domain-containing protein [Natronobacterium texcoconense]SDQ45129.1 Methyltransferase domain-containing protein [Natronobacterium texcoconense]
MSHSLDTRKLEQEVKAVYSDVARTPDEEFHFEMGRPLAERLGYPPDELDEIPEAAVDSFAGVGYHFDLADLQVGEDLLDLGSGSGMDAFVAAMHVGDSGSVIGLDMTDEQLAKARALRDDAGLENVRFEQGYVERLPFADESFDVVVSNGVINLSAEKDRVFEEIHRVLRPGGRLAVSDIISESRMPASIKENADLWAACIGGAEQIDDYASLLELPGFEMTASRDNPQYEFTSERAQGACQRYGVKSISLVARKE